ncbi:MAG: EAL domain-containing protein, partial [Acetivibrio ethanolgignens]
KCIATLQKNVRIENAVNNILEYIGGFYKADRAYVFEIDNNKQIINNTYEWCDESIEPEIDNLQCLPIKSIERWLKAFEEEEYIYISSLEKIVDHDSLEYEVLEMQGIETLIAAPFFDNEEQIVGFIGVDNPSEHKGAANLLISIADFIVNDLEKRSLIEELEKKSFTDMLTGLGNRNAFFYRLEELKKESELSIGVIYMDINDLKSLNSKHGNFCGDVILKKTAEHMFATLKNDIYRIGGDEFVAICVGVSKTEFSEIIKKVKNALESEFEYSVSMGMKWRSGDNDIEAILNEAEEIMLVEKMEFYRNAERNKITRYTFFEEEIKSDISRDKYEVFFQPKVDLQNGEVIGAEALIRKKEKEGEYISPAKFVTHLEKEGLIRYIDFFVLETVCRMLKEWDKRGTLIQCISVNFSRITLMDKNVFNKITEICDKYSVDYGRITIEVTESIGKIDSQYLRVLLDKIQKNGFRVSLDDFGSRYSNLAILSMISFDEIKFDKSIVENIIEDNKSEV